jgi:hypothetical protein
MRAANAPPQHLLGTGGECHPEHRRVSYFASSKRRVPIIPYYRTDRRKFLSPRQPPGSCHIGLGAAELEVRSLAAWLAPEVEKRHGRSSTLKRTARSCRHGAGAPGTIPRDSEPHKGNSVSPSRRCGQRALGAGRLQLLLAVPRHEAAESRRPPGRTGVRVILVAESATRPVLVGCRILLDRRLDF